MARRTEQEIALDVGHAEVKVYNRLTGKRVVFRSILAALDDATWRHATAQGIPPGYALVNGAPYAYGDAARGFRKTRPTGANRYTEVNYGVMAALAMNAVIDNVRPAHVHLMGMYPPVDHDYVPHQRAAVLAPRKGWSVDTGEKSTFKVLSFTAIDEPIGGVLHFMFTHEGAEKANNPLVNARTLVIDSGGHTLDLTAIDPNGEVDWSSARSFDIGLLPELERLGKLLRAREMTRFRGVHEFPRERLEEALYTGRYRYGRVDLDCQKESEQIKYGLLNAIDDAIQMFGDKTNYDALLLTGGGAHLLHSIITEAYPDLYVYLAERDHDKALFANVFGASKFLSLREMTNGKK